VVVDGQQDADNGEKDASCGGGEAWDNMIFLRLLSLHGHVFWMLGCFRKTCHVVGIFYILLYFVFSIITLAS
jgi:hypothetical protein